MGRLDLHPFIAVITFPSFFLLGWHQRRQVGSLQLYHLPPGMGRPPLPNQCQWRNNEEPSPYQPGGHRKKPSGKPGFPPLPCSKEGLYHTPRVSREVYRGTWTFTPTWKEQSITILPLPVRCQRRPTKTEDLNKIQSLKT